MCGLRAYSCTFLYRTKTPPLLNFRRQFSKFDIFKKLSDTGETSTSTTSARKPSDRVIRLVDEILNLTLIEAADLCDLCQEKLAERSGKEAIGLAPGRSPFPHPQSMFAYGNIGPMSFMPGQPVSPIPAMPDPMHDIDNTINAQGQQTVTPNDHSSSANTENNKMSDSKVSIKLLSFDTAKKIAVVKQIRTITGLGLRESKDLVEGAPKVLKKGITRKEADEIKKALDEAGATTEIY